MPAQPAPGEIPAAAAPRDCSGADPLPCPEPDVIALDSPNGVVVHPDGGGWFTDPRYGINGWYEGAPAASDTREAVYRVAAASGRVDFVTDEVVQPNGLCFAPD